ncbi:MFS transporter [Nocardia sputorum]|uniref:MFS transporter n=1 Tax=Nocardia sputorum TaxID=2984338 RepID=UPI00248F6D93|nr:MFS transporter [Nocardia sputorum]
MPAALSRRILPLLAVTCGFSSANAHFSQTLTPQIAQGIGVSPTAAAIAVTVSQFGCGAGIFLFTPLGDRISNRWLIVGLLGLAAVGLLIAASTSELRVLLVASAVIGASTAVPSIIVAMAAGLVPEGRRGSVVGALLGGVTGGIVLARTVAGVLGQWCDWRAPYFVGAGCAGCLALVLTFVLPTTVPESKERYLSLLRTTLLLLRGMPELRQLAFGQSVVYASFIASWTSAALVLAGPDYGLDGSAIGLVAMVGAVGLFASPWIGHRIDQYGYRLVSIASLLATAIAGFVFLAGSRGGPTGLAGLVLGIVVLDAAMRSGQVANQVAALTLSSSERSRVNTVFMTCVLLGGSAGSLAGVQIYSRLGWTGVCVFVIVMPCIPLARHLRSM